MPLRQHALRRFLGDKKTAESGDRERLLDFGGIELDEGTAGAVTGIIDDHVRGAVGALNLAKEVHDIAPLGGVASESLTADLLRQRREIGHAARRERYLDTGLGKSAGDRRGKPAADADDEGGS